jgi:fructokinase
MLAISQKYRRRRGGAHARQLLRRRECQAGRRTQGGRGRVDGRLTRGTTSKLLAGVELGGTKCVCILGSGPDDVRASERLPTGEREDTLRQIDAVLERWRQQHGPARALGIASFGPVDLRADSATYGFITSTTKPGWRNTDVAQRLSLRLGIPVGFDTDVNGAAPGRRPLGRGAGPG